MKFLIPAATLALLPMAVFAHDGMHVNDAYARSSNPVTGSVFMQLENHRESECRLLGVSSDMAERVELHTHVESDGVMRMTRIEDGIAVPGGEKHDMGRGGDHVMLMGMRQPLEDGDAVALALDFGDCGIVDVEAVVDNQRNAGDAHGGGDDHAHH